MENHYPLLHFEDEEVWFCLKEEGGLIDKILDAARTRIFTCQKDLEDLKSFFHLEGKTEENVLLATFQSAFSPSAGFWFEKEDGAIFQVSKKKLSLVCEIVKSRPMEFYLAKRKDNERWEFV